MVKAYPLNLDNKNKLDFVSRWQAPAQGLGPPGVDNIENLYQVMSIDDGAPVVRFQRDRSRPDYVPAEEWPFTYSGVTPDYSSLEESAFARGHFLRKPDYSSGLEPNNIGVFNPADSTIYTCLRVYTDGLPGSFGGIGEFDIEFTVFSPEEGTVQVSGLREFNETGAFNEYGELPDCSGKLETTTGIYTDIIQSGDDIFQTTFSLTDPANLTLRLESYETLSH